MQVNDSIMPVLAFSGGQGVVEDIILPGGIVKGANVGMSVIPGGVYFGGGFALFAPPIAENSLFTKLYFQFGKDTPFSLGFWNSYTKTYLLDDYAASKV